MHTLRTRPSRLLSYGFVLTMLFCAIAIGVTAAGAATPAAATRGATLPYIEYEAEEGAATGTIVGPTRTFGQVAAEASGRRFVRLAATGQYVEFTAAETANSIVIRHNIPDASSGGGIVASISLYVNGVHRQDIMLSSKQAWLYGGETGYSNDPATGSPHRFFDENRALVGDIPAGATVRLQKDTGDVAAYYNIDLIDLEQVADPLTMPAGFVSITDYGATPDDGTDDNNAIYDAIHAAKQQGKGVWIPAGTFNKTGGPVVRAIYSGYSGAGYVTGYEYYGAKTAFYPTLPAAGPYTLTLRYANGTGSAKTLGLYVEGVRTQITLPPTADWSTWSSADIPIAVTSTRPGIEFIRDYGDSGQVNLDYMLLAGLRVEIETGKMVAPVFLDNVTIRGAGMWHSTLYGKFASFYMFGNNNQFYDFALTGDTTTRDDTLPDNAFNGSPGTGSLLQNIWIEHTKVGFWVGNDNTPYPADGLVITGSRFRNLFADGVNFTNGTSNSEIVNSHFRNTGDDALASWGPSFAGGVNTNNIFHFNTVQVPWRANCLAIYGGVDNKIEDNLCSDTTTYPGILVATAFDAHPLGGTTSVQRNSLIRAGGSMWGGEYGALTVQALQHDISNLTIADIDIQDATYSGVRFSGPMSISNVTLTNVSIDGASTYGVYVTGEARGEVTFTNPTITNTTSGDLNNLAGSSLVINGLSQPVVTDQTLIEDFNGGLPADGVFVYGRDTSDAAGHITVTAESVDLPVVPAIAGNQALAVDFSNAGWGGFIERGYLPDGSGFKDWSAYQGVSFWLLGTGSGGTVIFQLKSDGTNQQLSNRYEYNLTDDAAGWRLVRLPWSAFHKGAGYNPGPNPDAPINPARMWGYAFILPAGATVFSADEIRLVGDAPVEDFNSGLPADGVFVYGRDTSDAAGHITVTAESVDLPVVPAIAGNQALSVDFSNTGWGGFVERGYLPDGSGFKDWSAYQGVSFWLRGAGSGGTVIFQLKSDGTNQQLSNRYEVNLTDNAAGWRLVRLPWPAFHKGAGYNPGPNPDAPINPARMWGYAFILPPGAAVFSADEITLYGGEGQVTPPTPPATPALIEDFDGGLPGDGVFVYGRDESVAGHITVTAQVTDIPIVPAIAGNQALSVDFSNAGWGGFVERGYLPDGTGFKDWSAYEGVSFWLLGTNSGGTVIFQLKSDGDNQQASNRYEYNLTDDVAGWRLISLPWSAFHKGVGYNPGPNPDAPINPAKMWGYAFILPAGATVFSADEIRLVADEAVEDFNSGLPADGVFVYGRDTGDAAGHITVTAQAADIPIVPGITGNQALSVDFSNAGWGGFVERGYLPDGTGFKDWSAYDGVSFWLLGTNSGGTVIFQLKSDGDNQQASNRYEYNLTDDVAGWRFVRLPFSAFHKGVGYNPGPNPDAPINPARMWGYAFILPPGAAIFSADEIALYGRQSGVITADFSSPAYEVSEGAGQATVTVTLSAPATSAVTVGYASQDATATAGSDYTAVAGTLTFDPGVTSLDFTVPVTDDAEYETNETLALALTQAVNAQVGEVKNPAALTILDNDNPPDIRVYDDMENGAWTGQTAFGVTLGYSLWWDPDEGTSVSITTVPATDALAVPGQAPDNDVLAFTYQSSRWGGLTYIPADGNNWPSQDWSRYDGVRFWLYGNNTGGQVQFEIFDNRALGSTGDTAERWYNRVTDDYTGWRKFSIPFSAFARRTDYQPAGAPNDGFNLTDVSGYAIGFPTGVGSPRTAYIDQVEVYGDLSQTTPTLRAELGDYAYGVAEGQTLTAKIILNEAPTTTVSVSYSTEPDSALASSDYVSTSGTLEFPAGTTSLTLTVPIVDDAAVEPTEQFTLVITGATGAAVGGKSLAVVVITDTDQPVTETDPTLVEDFENGLPEGLVITPDSGIAVSTAQSLDVPFLPASSANNVLVIASTSLGRSGGRVNRVYTSMQDWSGYKGIGFWFLGTNSRDTVRFVIIGGGSDAAGSSQYAARFVDSFTGWRYIRLPWLAFTRLRLTDRSADRHGSAMLSPNTTRKVWGYGFQLPRGSMTLAIDQIALIGTQLVDTFDIAIPPTLTSTFMPQSTGTVSFTRQALALPVVPGKWFNKVLSVDYNVSGWGGGITRDFTGAQDWSQYHGFTFWFYGSGSGNPVSIELKTGGPDPAHSNRYEVVFTDNFLGWRLVQIPWGSFAKRTTYNPGPDPDAPLSSAEVWGYSVIMPRSSGRVAIDEVGVYGGMTK